MVLALCIVFALILSVALGALGFYTYYHNIWERYEKYMETILLLVDSEIAAQDAEACIRTGVKSWQYEKTQKALDKVKTLAEVEYIYVVRPLNTSDWDNAMYVWNAVTESEALEDENIKSLGDLSEGGFPKEMAESFQTAMADGRKVTYLLNNTGMFGHILTGLYPVCKKDGEAVALIGVDIQMDKIYSNMYQYLAFVFCGMMLVGVVFLFLFFQALDRSVVAPVIRMAESAQDFVRQSESAADPAQLSFQDPLVDTGDEMELLSGNLKRMTSKLVEYMGNLRQATAERERISAELDVATGIQSSMLPHVFPAFPERTEFDVYASLKVAREMGGSFYDLFLVDQNHLALVIGEIGGRGIPAALLMVITRTLIKNHVQLGYSPDKALARTNDQLSESNEGMTTTAFLGVIDLTTGILDYVNAGHCAPLLKRAGGDFSQLSTKDCFVLGSMAGVPYWQQSVQLVQGDLLFLCTKGLEEAENEEQMQYSREHMQMRLNHAVKEAYGLDEIARIMSDDVEGFMEGALPTQDIAMLLFRFFGA